MKSIKQQYIDLQEGNMSQANFMRNLRMTLPQYVTNVTSFEDSVRILKNKGILTEADTKEGLYNSYTDVVNAITKKYSYKVYHDEIEEFMQDKASLEAIMAGKDPIVAYEEFYKIQRESLKEAKDEKGKWTNTDGKSMYDQFKEINNLNGQEVLIGIDYEMEKNEELTKQEAQKIVIKNLKKIPNYYTNQDLSGVEGFKPDYIGGKSANAEARQMQPLEKNLGNIVDKKMGMKPVKDVEKVKKDSDKGGETNKMEKGISLMSLIAKSVRGVQKMDATGEKMKKISMKEAKLNNFPGEEPNEAVKLAMQFIESNPVLKKYSDEFTIQNGQDDAILKYNYWEAIPEEVFNKLELQFEVEEDVEEHDDKSPTIAYFLKPKHKMSDVNLGGSFDKFKDQLKEMIRKELKETFDGMEPMDRTGLDNE
jgi:hypothetical protein